MGPLKLKHAIIKATGKLEEAESEFHDRLTLLDAS